MGVTSGDTEVVKERYIKGGDIYITPVLLLCTECQQPIKATITTAQWIKVEWIGPSGECQACYNLKKQQAKEPT